MTLTISTNSCKKDKEDPTISVETPEQHSIHNWGTEVHITADFADDQGLKDYTIMVVDADGNHSMAFDFMRTGTVSELTYDFHDHFDVPDSAPEMAWVQFVVTDAENKTTTLDWMLHFEE